MINTRRLLVAICINSLFAFSTYAVAPVVDDSENFAMLDEQEGAYEQPLAHEQKNNYYQDEEPALANDAYDTSSSATKDNASLLEKVQALKQEVQELRGQLEVQSHDLKVLQEQQLSFYKDLDARLRKEQPIQQAKTTTETPVAINTTPALAATVPATSASVETQPKAKLQASTPAIARTNPADEQISYLAAYELVKNKKYDEAITAMQSFAERFPQGGYTANAQYWLGELYMVKKDYPQAIEHFEIVLKQFSSSPKTAASMLKLGYAYAAAGNIEEAKSRLQQVIKAYPDTNTAQLAIAKLDALD
ncbi:outer membrane protein (plasmid) [Legionella adelaidensis]|uniref:Cell division coordinator CpoB n=1 Tax=Legionella adelaidensis TaxID=45056 RepID=A0A0W0R0B0_9GAMM|nr:tol-pal system protein YbgF [Legionella adelaidensis]KTC64482.1 outer membrane protein [Legionella adelaidensis]VEH85850.1 outer membrane protein [Legionella adelaidensis]